MSVTSSGAQFTTPPGRPVGTEPAISGNGRFVAFTSWSTDAGLGSVHTPNPASDVWVHDRVTGRTQVVSVGYAGTPAVGVDPGSAGTYSSRWAALSANGRYVAFESWATNLTRRDLNAAPDIFVRDMATGTTRLASVSSTGEQQKLAPGAEMGPAFAGCGVDAISDNGRYVAFSSPATNLVPGDTNSMTDIFVHDTVSGRTFRGSLGTGGVEPNGASCGPSLSADGRYLVFTSSATNLGIGSPALTTSNVYLRDLKTGTTSLVSHTQGGAPQHSLAYGPQSRTAGSGRVVSTDGRYVAFLSNVDNFVPADNNYGVESFFYGEDNGSDVFVADMRTGGIERVSVTPSGGQAARFAGDWVTMSADGRYVAFDSYQLLVADEVASGTAASYAALDTSQAEVFVHDMRTGDTEMLSRTTKGDQALGCTFIGGQANEPAMDMSGRFVAFASCAPNLPPGSSNSGNVYLRDRGHTLAVDELVGAGHLAVAGNSAFAATGVATATAPAWARVLHASLAYRASRQDLLLRLDLARLPTSVLADPAVLFGFDLAVGGRRYEVRVSGSAVASHFSLWRTDRGHAGFVGSLDGGYGTVGPAVVVAVPLATLGASRAARIAAVSAFSGLGSDSAGVVRLLDRLAFG
jgi:Tol biopolymer transport system component